MFSALQTKKIDIYAKISSQDQSGQVFDFWSLVLPNIDARMSEAPKNFVITDDNYKATEETYIFFVDAKYAGLITKYHRVVYQDREYYVLKVANFQGRSNVHHVEIYAQVVSLGVQSELELAMINLNDYVLKTTTINGKSLDTNVELEVADIPDLQDELDSKQQIGINYDDLKYSVAFTGSSVVVSHNLGKYPSITVIDSAGDEVVGDVTHNSVNQATIVFSAPFSGTVYCN